MAMRYSRLSKLDVGRFARQKSSQSIFPKIAPPVGIPTPDVTSA
jgi:hypothetical protein